MEALAGEVEKGDLAGRVIAGRYRLEALLGEGGMGEVYRATDGEGHELAVKVMHRALLGSAATQRFLREAELMRTIEHPNVIPTLDTGFDSEHDALYITMPLLRGSDARALVDRVGAVHPLTAVRIVVQACAGVAAAHRAGVVHRDIKPANVFLDATADGNVIVRVCDFGIAKHLAEGDAASLTATGARIGSPLYMSPEQLRSSKHVDARTDVWALGVTLYELLCGAAPHAGIKSATEVLVAVATVDAPELLRRAPWVPLGLSRAVHRALARDPAGRFPTVDALSAALEEHVAGDHTIVDSMLVTVPDSLRPRAGSADADTRLLDATVVRPSEQPVEEDAVLGQVLDGRYRVTALLGRGGMGAVYEVEAPDGQRFAAKVIASAPDAQLRRRFVREARAAIDLVSPNVVRTLEAGEDTGLRVPFIIMELLGGEDLGTLLKREGPIEPPMAARLFVQAARGIAAAHARGIIHRDIKPANLFLQENRETGVVTVKVCDFGVAKLAQVDGDTQTGELTRTGGVLGSPMYMSPEQARNAKNVDFRTDLWSLSATLWEALTGRRLWEGRTALGEIILAVCSDPIPEVGDAAPWVDADFARVVQAGLARDPRERWSNAEEMIAALEQHTGGSMEVPAEALRGVTLERRAEASSASRLSIPSQSAAAVSAHAATISASAGDGASSIVSTSTEARPLTRQKRRSWAFVAAGVAVVAAVAAFLKLDPTPDPAPTEVLAADQRAGTSSAPTVTPLLAGSRDHTLTVTPPDASVIVNGVAVSSELGRVVLVGEPGDTFEVTISHGGIEKRERVFLTKDGTLDPPSIALGTGAAPPTAPAKPSPIGPRAPGGPAPAAKIAAPPAKTDTARPLPPPKAGGPVVKPTDDW